MNNEMEDQTTDSEDEYIHSGVLEDNILMTLKMQLQQWTSEAQLLEAFLGAAELGHSEFKNVDKDKIRYALAVLETEGLIHAEKQEDGTIVNKISRDGLRSFRARDRELDNRRWAKMNRQCRCTD